jgi:hypothetical protein
MGKQQFFERGGAYYIVVGEHGPTRVDEHGNPVERTKEEYPYSYDGFVTWRGGENSEANSTVYSDRLRLWDRGKGKLDALLEKHFGDSSDHWFDRSPEAVEAFFQDYLNKPGLKLIFIMEYCNQATGYPLWRFDVAY